MATPRLQIRPGNPDFLDLSWQLPVLEWENRRIVEMPTGFHRHPLVFVAYDEGVYAIKELPVSLAAKEYEVLRLLRDRAHVAAEVAGLVVRPWLPEDEEASSAVITKYVKHSFPYIRLVSEAGFGPRRTQMLDALANLLVELHLAGCYWGDCSLSNVLYRYDAGAIDAVMIDAETSTLREQLSRGQREEDLAVMRENLAGDMANIAALKGLQIDEADFDLGQDVESRYAALWETLNEELVISSSERHRVRERIGRLNDLGFSVEDVLLEPEGDRGVVKMRIRVGGRTYHSQRLRELTGIDASENQARTILGDLHYHLAKAGWQSPTLKSVGTLQWLSGSFEPTIATIKERWHGEDPVQGFCDLLHYRFQLSKAIGSDVSTAAALDGWEAAGFPGFPLEDNQSGQVPERILT